MLKTVGNRAVIVPGSVNIIAAVNTDISAQIVAAQATLGAAGGKIYLPSGTFFAQNIPLIDYVYYEGAGETVTQIKLPNGATSSMFIAAADLTVGWGFANIYFSGIYNSTLAAPFNNGTTTARSPLNWIDCSAATNIQFGVIRNCRIENFNYGYLGAGASATNFDWYPTFIDCIFQYNNYGISFSEHVQFGGKNFFWLNGITNGTVLTGGAALTGRANDLTVNNVWFNGNYIDAIASGSNKFVNTQWIGCGFFAAVNANLVLDGNFTIVGGAAWAAVTNVTYFLRIRPASTGVGYGSVTGMKLNEAGASFRGGCIDFLDGGVSSQYQNITIAGNEYQCTDATAGPFINMDNLTNNGSTVTICSFGNNTGSHKRTAFIKHTGAPWVYDLNINGNTWNVQGDYTAATALALMDFKAGTAPRGNNVSGNTLLITDGGKCNVFSGTVYNSNITGNIFDQDSGTIAMFLAGAVTTGATIQNNKGYVTRNSGTAAFVAATAVVVTHGLATTPSIQDILLTPQGACLTPPYVSTVTSTQFTINIAGATTASIGWVASCNN